MFLKNNPLMYLAIPLELNMRNCLKKVSKTEDFV